MCYYNKQQRQHRGLYKNVHEIISIPEINCTNIKNSISRIIKILCLIRIILSFILLAWKMWAYVKYRWFNNTKTLQM